MPQPLSSKESSLFRTVVRNYEDKQYKKGLKAADQILKKNPKHGDTLAMKALIINSQGKSEEAFALAKVALQCDFKSHVCWHVYGLLYRAAKNFEEAIKAYKFALKLEPDSQQIQRDLALLQIQMRDYQGHIHSRRAMLGARSGIRQNWTALAVALHLNGELAEAEKASESIMYKNSLIAEQGDIKRALEHLESDGKYNLDKLAVLELKAKYLFELGRKEEAVKALDIDPTDLKARKAVYDEYAEKYPRCDAARRLPLDFLEGEAFREVADKYIRRMLDKGVPSTFANLKHLYADASKKEILPSVVQQYIESGKSEENSEPKRNGDTSKGNSSAYYFLAQHYNYYLSRDLDKALEYIEKAIELEPESVDFHMTKARIFKHKGDTQKASEIMEQARSLDTRDRHINTKAAKYQLRNDENENALKTMGMFTRAETVGGPLADLHDMHRAALSAVKVYLALHDKPVSNGVNGSAEETQEDALERKKAAKKARKEAERLEKEALAKKNEPNKPVKDQDGELKKKDDDPNGEKLAATTEPLNDAMKFLTPLLQFSPKNIDAQILGFEVFLRRQKYLLALKCLIAATAIDKENTSVQEQKVRFKKLLMVNLRE
ncbi:hypothetical protein DID88_001187 [Monilinia fructigena]|uniref:Uncharacterized protein n=1 Tax=Monilinia fructigena TaxID=38457 RepID=A0A395IXR7_9HELO|nr:hypothetical protein DID88_001187 [Monilinia fructigena]